MSGTPLTKPLHNDRVQTGTGVSCMGCRRGSTGFTKVWSLSWPLGFALKIGDLPFVPAYHYCCLSTVTYPHEVSITESAKRLRPSHLRCERCIAWPCSLCMLGAINAASYWEGCIAPEKACCQQLATSRNAGEQSLPPPRSYGRKTSLGGPDGGTELIVCKDCHRALVQGGFRPIYFT